MEWCGHEHCCGAAELGQFNQDTDYTDYAPTQEGLAVALSHMRVDRRGYVTATTIAEQKAAVALLKRNKFRVLSRFRNPNTNGTWVTLWGRKL